MSLSHFSIQTQTLSTDTALVDGIRKVGYSDINIPQRQNAMKQNLTISRKGQITLPAELRRKYGLEAGGTVIAEERNGELVLRPAAVLEIEIYKDEDIALWDDEDRLDEQTRRLIKEKAGSQE